VFEFFPIRDQAPSLEIIRVREITRGIKANTHPGLGSAMVAIKILIVAFIIEKFALLLQKIAHFCYLIYTFLGI